MLGGGMVSRVSAPEQKPLPVPVSTTHVMSLSASISSNTAASGTINSNAIEFIRSGRFIRMTAVPGRGRSTRTTGSPASLFWEWTSGSLIHVVSRTWPG